MLVIFSIFTSLSNITRAQDSTGGPAIYYYSSEDQAFVVETTDGKDRYTLAKYIMSEGQESISGPAWSPSGEWFAWNTNSSQVALVHQDGSQPLIFPTNVDETLQIQKSEWSQEDDILSIFRTRNAGIGIEYFDFYMIDIESGQSLFEFSLNYDVQNSDDAPLAGTFWVNSEAKSYFYYSDPVQFNNLHIMSIDSDGNSSETSIDVASQGCNLPFSFSPNGALYIPSQGSLMYADKGLIESLQVPMEFNPDYVSWIDWNPQGTDAFLYTNSSCDDYDNVFDLWLLSTERQEIRSIKDEILSDEYVKQTHWSKQSNKGWFLYGDSVLVLISVEPKGDIATNEISVEDIIYDTITWSTRDDLVFIENNIHRVAYIYNDRDKALIPLIDDQEAQNISVGTMSISEDYRYIAILGECFNQFNTPCIFDRSTKEMTQLSTNTVNAFGSYGELLWHPKENWLLIGEFVEENRVYLRVTNPDGSSSRELGYCNPNRTCYGWMP